MKSQAFDEWNTRSLAQAVFIVNRHAKSATNPKFLYQLKKAALLKLITEKKAVKKGLHFSNNPKLSQQQSDVLVECANYLFHIPPTKSDFSTLPHLGKLNTSFRNPKTHMSLHNAKNMLQAYTGIQEIKQSKKSKVMKPVFKRLGERYD